MCNIIAWIGYNKKQVLWQTSIMKWSDYLIFIETERLYLRSWQPKDLAALIEMNQDPKVMKYFPKSSETK